jgi:hypothetical protein
MPRHTHQYTIADDEAVQVMIDKLLSSGPHQQRRERLLKALEEASRQHRGQRAQGIFSRTADGLRSRPKAVVTSPQDARRLLLQKAERLLPQDAHESARRNDQTPAQESGTRCNWTG